jgi:DNA invertase Pin-like site-specific DNA recombinase
VKKKETGKLIGYARVSTEDQDLRLQIDALERAGCWNIWQEKRSELEKALIDLRPGDTLVVWKLDRLIRNARDAYKLLDRVEEAGATVISLTEPHLNVHTPIGEFMLGMTALLAQLEVRQTAFRTSAGIKALQDQGYMYGRERSLSEAKHAALLKDRRAGMSYPELGKKYKVSTATARNYVMRTKRKPKPRR